MFNGNSQNALPLPETGQYVVRVNANDLTSTGTYNLGLECQSGNAIPIAVAGGDQSVSVGNTVQLNGGASNDSDGDTLTFLWTITSAPVGSTAVLGNATTQTPTLVPDLPGTYTIQLIVNDGTEDSSPDTVTLIATAVPEVTLVATDSDASETGPDTATFTVTRTGPTTNPLTVLYGITGTATNGADYQTLSGSVVIPANQVSATIIVTPIDDPNDEGPESVVLNLTPHAAYTIGTPGIANATIADNDVVVSVVATDPNASEIGPDTGAFTFTRSGGDVTQDLLVHVQRGGTATNGLDYVGIGGSTFFVTIPANQTSAVLGITPLADANGSEGNETVIMTIVTNAAYAIGAAGSAMVTIADAGPPPSGLNVVVTTHPNIVKAGERVLYEITVSNVTAGPMSGVVVRYAVPIGQQFLGSSDSNPNAGGCGVNNNLCTAGEEASWSLGTLAAGASTTIQVNALVVAGTAAGTLLRTPVAVTATGLGDTISVEATVVVDNP